MKFRNLIHIFFTAIIFFIHVSLLSAQTGCPGCNIDLTCYDADGPTLCPSSLPDGTQGQYYDTDVTFWMPQSFVYSGVTVTLLQIVITGITGLPQGISWQANNSNLTYIITSDPATQRGCVKLCGTPTIPGNFTVNVSVVATVNTPLGQQIQNESFSLELNILPQPGGNPYFNYNPASGCDEAQVTFEALINIGPPSLTEYEWDFGNGQTSTSQFPAPVLYNSPGIYPVTLQTKVYDHIFSSLTVSASGNWWTGDIEELFGGQPDLYFVLTHGGATYQSNYVSDNNTASFNNLGIVLSSLSISISVWDYDPISANDDGGTFTFQIPGPGTYNYSTNSPSGGGTNGQFTIVKQLDTIYAITDTVLVYTLPPAVNISVSPALQVCEGQNIVLSVYGGYNYQWFENDTLAIPNAQDSVFIVTATSGLPISRNLKVKIIDPQTGCATMTPSVTVTINPGIPSNFSTNGIVQNVFNPNILTTSFFGNFTYQWLWNGLPINPGGNSKDLQIPGNGNFSLIITNQYGCSDTSNIISINNFSVPQLDFQEQLEFSLWPNPSQDIVYLKFSEFNGQNAQLSILDLSGRSIQSWPSLKFVDKQGLLKVDVQSLSSGLYYFKLEYKGQSVIKPLLRY